MPAKKYFTDEERREAIKQSLKRSRAKHRDAVLQRQKEYRKRNLEKAKSACLDWYYKNREKYNAHRKEYRRIHRGLVSEQAKNQRNKNIDAYRKMQRKWYHDNLEKRKISRTKTREKHRDAILAYAKAYSKRFPEKGVMRQANRRAKTRHHPTASKEKILALYHEAKRLSASTGVRHCVDHVIPIHFGGFQHEENLQVITFRLNAQKWAHPFWLSPHPGIKDWRDVPRELWPVDLVPKYLALLEQHKGESIRWDAAA